MDNGTRGNERLRGRVEPEDFLRHYNIRLTLQNQIDLTKAKDIPEKKGIKKQQDKKSPSVLGTPEAA